MARSELGTSWTLSNMPAQPLNSITRIKRNAQRDEPFQQGKARQFRAQAEKESQRQVVASGSPCPISVPRPRTFPISQAFPTIFPHSGNRKSALHSAVIAIDFMTSGHSLFKPPKSNRTASLRVLRCLTQRLGDVKLHIGPDLFKYLYASPHTVIPIGNDCNVPPDTRESLHIHHCLEPAVSRDDFQMLNADKIDLPRTTRGSSNVWTSTLPTTLISPFEDPKHEILLSPMITRIQAGMAELPKVKVNAIDGHYCQVLLKAHLAGMITAPIHLYNRKATQK